MSFKILKRFRLDRELKRSYKLLDGLSSVKYNKERVTFKYCGLNIDSKEIYKKIIK